MPLPILAAHLVGNQLVGRASVRNAQQRFGEAHQHHALFRGQRIFLHEGIDTALLSPSRTYRRHQLPGQFRHAALVVIWQGRLGGQGSDGCGFIGKQPGSNGGTIRQNGHGRSLLEEPLCARNREGLLTKKKHKYREFRFQIFC